MTFNVGNVETSSIFIQLFSFLDLRMFLRNVRNFLLSK